MKGEKPRRFERLCYRALVEGVVSHAKAAELLGISLRELSRRMEEPLPISKPSPRRAGHRERHSPRRDGSGQGWQDIL